MGPTAMEAYFGGAYWEDYKLWRESSPLSYVNNMETPALILHGASDIRVPVTQAMQLYSALKEKGTPTRFIYYRGQGTWDERSCGNSRCYERET
jgi:dipeptidyl aminopeptidase/acylaminoacyl peptidase